MFKNSKGPELPAWVFLALRLGALVAVAVAAALIVRCKPLGICAATAKTSTFSAVKT